MLTVSAVLVFFLGGYARYSGYSTPRRSGSEVETRRTTERGGWGNGERREHSGRDGGVRGERDSDRDMQDMRKCENAKKWRGHGLGKVPEETFSHLRIFAYKNVVVYFQKTEPGCRKWHVRASFWGVGVSKNGVLRDENLEGYMGGVELY